MQHEAKKRFGQNFLTDDQIIDRIIASIRPQKTDELVEIGPGLGALTQHLLQDVATLNIIEIDHDLIPVLQKKFKHDHLVIHEADALKFDYSTLAKSEKKLRVVGNLPYNISTPLLFHLIHYAIYIEDMHFMLQQEVVDRICANPGNKDYGRLSVMIQYYCQTERLFTVPPEAFHPKPKVYSAIVRLKPWVKKPHEVSNIKLFEEIVAKAFSQRRKTLRNTLKNVVTPEQWQTLNIDPQLRAEMLSVEDFVRISQLHQFLY